MKFSNTYNQLDAVFFQPVAPTPVRQPELLLWNTSLANELNIAPELQNNSALLAQYFSGNQLPVGAEPIAQAYAGHQFGHFNPQLGDGRAHLLGELINNNGQRVDIALKGSGPTAFSRQGDGRCALGPAVREFIMSEAMAALGVPTTRCLAVVKTGELVFREQAKMGAVVTRIAASHLRVGTFQYFSAQGNLDALASLTEYAINRHYSEITSIGSQRIIDFLQAVIDKQITLVVAWSRVGFIHGVMNTDNTAISGETIDFGPCAMMNHYHLGTVFSSIDRNSRYAFGNQGRIAQWNMARLAEALLPLINEDQAQAVALVEPLIMKFSEQYQAAFYQMMANKLGCTDSNDAVIALVDQLLILMQEQALDYTNTFIALQLSLDDDTHANKLKTQLGDWYQAWRDYLVSSSTATDSASALMTRTNPLVIPRNHNVEAVLAQFEQQQTTDINEFLTILRDPYHALDSTAKYQLPPSDGDSHYRTFCGT
ncbi:protein adenylyltransferase SelO [Pseudoalteromonas tunicata]|uniref:protein adenylyltransferase SelO n=1 Tax=Pseudoalteromonas tunicata TaxID=314281 RepID=UPI00273D4685|nr:YdiU family protein [Pseudoalteromonas tunicata]MDP4982445.1 YdiU family protein [Pseudoalteromonas tunicata]